MDSLLPTVEAVQVVVDNAIAEADDLFPSPEGDREVVCDSHLDTLVQL